jgi:hypothetical protein
VEKARDKFGKMTFMHMASAKGIMSRILALDGAKMAMDGREAA